MGRRITSLNAMARLPPNSSAQEVREKIGKHFRFLTGRAAVNLAQFRAQLHEEDMVEILVGFAMDATLPPQLRRQCALDVVTVARGPIEPWRHDGQRIDPAAQGATGRPVGEEIEAARASADLFQELDDLVRRRVPTDQWPPHVVKAVGDTVALFASIPEDGS